ncbi:MAG TPA: M56 family metallopeptidase [Chitinophagaceae bacterium]|nr:M56 family metallopeptidase [Chitinophagaceae bacterium]
MILYLLKTIGLSAIFYLVYRLMLRNSKDFRFSRFYLITAPVLAAFCPLFHITLAEPIAYAPPMLQSTLQQVDIYSGKVRHAEWNISHWLGALFFIGMLWGIARLILGFLVIRRTRKHASVDSFQHLPVYYSPLIESPFSFFNAIYIPASLKNPLVLSNVLKHEYTHYQMKHSYDKLYFSIAQILFWFNPFIYLFHKELELVHEFACDDRVSSDSGRDQYIESILQSLAYEKNTPSYLIHSFFNHPLKNRIAMLYQKPAKTVLRPLLSALLVTSVLLLTLWTQSTAQDRNSKPQPRPAPAYGNPPGSLIITADGETPDGKPMSGTLRPNFDSLYEQVDVMPEFPGGNEALNAFIVRHVHFPEGAGQKEHKVMLHFIVNKQGEVSHGTVHNMPVSDDPFEKEALKLVPLMPRWKPGMQNGRPVDVGLYLPVLFRR